MRIVNFPRNENGAVAIIFAVIVMVLLLAGGGTIDYARNYSDKVTLQNILDAAALAGAAQIDRADAVSKSYIKANTPVGFNITSVKVDTDLQSGTVSVTAKHNVPFYFLPLIGMKIATINAVSTAIAGGHMDVYFMLDRSASMLIADGDQAIADMNALTYPMFTSAWTRASESEGCAFACHEVPSDTNSMSWAPDDRPLIDYAIDRDIPLRTRRVTQSAKLMARTMLANSQNRMKIGLLDFGASAELTLPTTSNINQIEDKITEFGPETINKSGTDYELAFNVLDEKIGVQGSGYSEANPQKTVVLVTDGLNTVFYPTADHYGPFKEEFCQSLKTKGISLAVVNIIYDSIPTSWNVRNLADPHRKSASNALKACAEPGMYFEANKPGEIETAFKGLANKIQEQKIRIIN